MAVVAISHASRSSDQSFFMRSWSWEANAAMTSSPQPITANTMKTSARLKRPMQAAPVQIQKVSHCTQ